MRYAHFNDTSPVVLDHPTHHHFWAGVGGLFLLLIGCNAVAVLCAVAVDPTAPYGALAVPWWAPTPEVLAGGAIAVYTMTAIAAWLVLHRGEELDVLVRWSMSAFTLLLAMGPLFAVALFGLHAPAIAIGIGAIMFVTVVFTMLRFSVTAGSTWMMLLPMMAAVALMTALAISIFVIDPAAPVWAPSWSPGWTIG